MDAATTAAVAANAMNKGDVLATARVAGIQAAKHAAAMLPMSHPVLVGNVHVNFTIADTHIDVEASVDTVDRTGVEMEALMAVTVAALTVYDMCKSADRTMTIEEVAFIWEEVGRQVRDVPPTKTLLRRRFVGGLRQLTAPMAERNVLGGELELCGTDPVTGFYRDGCCTSGPEDLGSHTICAVVTAEFLEHQRSIGNDLSTPMPEYGFRGLVPGDRWCADGRQLVAGSSRRGGGLTSSWRRPMSAPWRSCLLEALREHAVDVPSGPGDLQA